MAEHTPGPWSIHPNFPHLICGPDLRLIARADVTTFVEPQDPRDSENKANARLIVRAVNAHDAMLAALRTIAYEPIGRSDASHADVLAQVVDIARAAIAAATGEPMPAEGETGR